MSVSGASSTYALRGTIDLGSAIDTDLREDLRALVGLAL